MHDDWSPERLEDELERMAGPGLDVLAGAGGSPGAAPGTVVELALPPGVDAALAIGIEAQSLWCAHAAGRAYWYASSELQPPRLLVSNGLPPAAALLGATIPA